MEEHRSEAIRNINDNGNISNKGSNRRERRRRGISSKSDNIPIYGKTAKFTGAIRRKARRLERC